MKRRWWVVARLMPGTSGCRGDLVFGAAAPASSRLFVLAAAFALLITALLLFFAWVPRLAAEARSWQVAEVIPPELAALRRAPGDGCACAARR